MSNDTVPAPKGASAHILANAAALGEDYDVSLFTLGSTPVPGYRHRPVYVRQSNWLRRGLEFNQRASRFLEHYDFDIFHVRSPFEGLAVPVGRPLIYEVNALYSIEAPYHYPAVARQPSIRKKLRTMELCLLDRSQLVLTPSKVTKLHLEDLGVPSERIKVVANAPTVQAHAPRHSGALEASSTVSVCYAGSLAPWQGIFELVAAMPTMPRNIHLTVMSGPKKGPKRRLQKLARRREVADRVHFVSVAPDDMRAELVKHDIGVAPLVPCERNLVQGCMPIKILDYAAAGLPVVAPDMPVVREILGANYPLYSRWSRSALVAEIVRLASQPALRFELANQAQTLVRDGFSRSAQKATLLSAYAGLANTTSA